MATDSPSAVIGRSKQGLANNALYFPTQYSNDVGYGTVMRIENYSFSLAATGGQPTVAQANTILGHLFLPLPSQLQETLSHQYAGQDIAYVVQGKEFGEALAQGQYGESLDVLAGVGERFGRGIIAGISQELGGAINAARGTVPNPFSVTLYERTNQRFHSFEWKLVPQTREDSVAIKKIVDTLRYYSLPQYDGAFLKFPNIFKIAFVGSDSLYGMAPCFLSQFSVNYVPNNTASFFGDTHAPTAVQLSLTFTEIEPLSKASLENGPYEPTIFEGVS